MTTLPDPPPPSCAIPGWGYALSHPYRFIALGFGSGLAPKAPGTIGSLAAMPIYWGAAHWLSPFVILWLCLPLFLFGCYASDRVGKELGIVDFGGIVWDEMVAVWALMALVPQTWWAWSGITLLFRVFDIWKPFPIHWLDDTFHNGVGVMLDDAVAAAYAFLAWRLIMAMF